MSKVTVAHLGVEMSVQLNLPQLIIVLPRGDLDMWWRQVTAQRLNQLDGVQQNWKCNDFTLKTFFF